MDSNKVTVSEDPHFVNGILHRRLSCTCGWKAKTLGLWSESMANHHILFTHGKGIVSFAGSEQQLELTV